MEADSAVARSPSPTETGLPPRRPSKRKELLILNCPRSGSRWMTQVLRQAGMVVRHERMGRHGTVGPHYAVEDYWYGPGYRADHRESYAFARVWHLTRHPLHSIASMAADLPEAYWHWQEKHTGIGWEPDRVLRAARHWMAWTRLIRRNAIQWTCHVERVEERWDEICGRLQLAPCPMPVVRTKTRHRVVPRRIAWDEIKQRDRTVYGELRLMASSLGYKE